VHQKNSDGRPVVLYLERDGSPGDRRHQRRTDWIQKKIRPGGRISLGFSGL